MSHQSYWQIGIDDISFNNEKTGLCSDCQVRSGSSGLAGTRGLAARVNGSSGSSEPYTICGGSELSAQD